MGKKREPARPPANLQLPARDLAHNVTQLREAPGLDLIGLAALYLGTLEDPESSTFRDKRRDLQKFIDFYSDHYGHLSPSEWFPAVSKRFVHNHLAKRLRKPTGERYAPSSIARIWSTVRHFGRWAYREHAVRFPHGSPVAGVSPPDEPEAAWQGLRPKDIDRLVTAAHALMRRPRRSGATNQGLRDLAFLHALLGSGLRVSEVIGLEIDQFDGRYFTDIVCKGGVRRAKVFIHQKENRVPIEEWFEERGDEPGPSSAPEQGSPCRGARHTESSSAWSARRMLTYPTRSAFA